MADAFREGRPSRAACATTGSEGTPKADGPCAVLWEGGKAQGKGGKARTACAEGGDAKGKAKGKAQGGRPCAVLWGGKARGGRPVRTTLCRNFGRAAAPT